MRRSLRVAFVSAFVAASAAACAAITDLQPLEFFEGNDGAVTEAGRDAGDGSMTDAGADVVDASEASVFAGCALVDADLCDDFDHGDPFSTRWSFQVGPQGVCSIATSATEALTKPLSLRAESLSNAEGGAVNVSLQKLLPSFVGEFSASFDVFFKVAPSSGVFLLQPLLADTYPNNNDAVNPYIAAFPGDGGVVLTAFNLRPFTGNQGELIGNVPLGKWAHVSIEVRRDTDAASTVETFVVEGGGVAAVTRKVPTEPPTAMPSAFIGLNSGGTVVEVFFDNVVLKTR